MGAWSSNSLAYLANRLDQLPTLCIKNCSLLLCLAIKWIRNSQSFDVLSLVKSTSYSWETLLLCSIQPLNSTPELFLALIPSILKRKRFFIKSTAMSDLQSKIAASVRGRSSRMPKNSRASRPSTIASVGTSWPSSHPRTRRLRSLASLTSSQS
jgi:hypothetical protein